MQLVTLPIEFVSLIQIGIQMVVVFIVTQLAKYGLKLEGYAAQVTAAIVSAIVVIVNAALANIPPSWEAIAQGILNLLVILLGSFGVYKAYRQAKPKASAG